MQNKYADYYIVQKFFSFLNVSLSFGENFLELVRSMWLLSF